MNIYFISIAEKKSKYISCQDESVLFDLIYSNVVAMLTEKKKNQMFF
jgi:hypothetical protein